MTAKELSRHMVDNINVLKHLAPWDEHGDFYASDERNVKYHYAAPISGNDANITSVALQMLAQHRGNKPKSWVTVLGVNRLPSQEYTVITTVLVPDQKNFWMDRQRVTEGLLMSYSIQDMEWRIANGCYIYGHPKEVLKAFEDMHPNALFENELPSNIRVMDTILQFEKHLEERNFSVPPFVLNE